MAEPMEPINAEEKKMKNEKGKKIFEINAEPPSVLTEIDK